MTSIFFGFLYDVWYSPDQISIRMGKYHIRGKALPNKGDTKGSNPKPLVKDERVLNTHKILVRNDQHFKVQEMLQPISFASIFKANVFIFQRSFMKGQISSSLLTLTRVYALGNY